MSFRSFRKFAAAAAVCCAAIQMTSPDLLAQSVVHSSHNGNYQLFLTLVNKDSRVRILVDDADYPCVKKAADMFCSDLKAITGREDAAKVENELRYSTKEALVMINYTSQEQTCEFQGKSYTIPARTPMLAILKEY